MKTWLKVPHPPPPPAWGGDPVKLGCAAVCGPGLLYFSFNFLYFFGDRELPLRVLADPTATGPQCPCFERRFAAARAPPFSRLNFR